MTKDIVKEIEPISVKNRSSNKERIVKLVIK